MKKPKLILIRVISKDVQNRLLREVWEKASLINFDLEEFQSIAAVRREYPERLPRESIIVLSEKLRDGSAQKLFKLFTTENKERTIISAFTEGFIRIARKEGFECIKNNLTRHGDPTLADLIFALLRENFQEKEQLDYSKESYDACGS